MLCVDRVQSLIYYFVLALGRNILVFLYTAFSLARQLLSNFIVLFYKRCIQVLVKRATSLKYRLGSPQFSILIVLIAIGFITYNSILQFLFMSQLRLLSALGQVARQPGLNYNLQQNLDKDLDQQYYLLLNIQARVKYSRFLQLVSTINSLLMLISSRV